MSVSKNTLVIWEESLRKIKGLKERHKALAERKNIMSEQYLLEKDEMINRHNEEFEVLFNDYEMKIQGIKLC